MNTKKSVLTLAILTLTSIVPAKIAFAILPQEPTVEIDPTTGEISIEFPPPPEKPNPETTAGGGTRGEECQEAVDKQETQLTALMPCENVVTTIAPNPTMFWYVPVTNSKSAELIIVEEATGKYIHNQTINIPETAGVIQVKLPETVSLELNKSYLWKFALICDSTGPSECEDVSGRMERTALTPELEEQLKKVTTPIEQAKLYAQYYLWNETISILAELRDSYPSEWKQLLNSVGIEEDKIVEAPFVAILN